MKVFLLPQAPLLPCTDKQVKPWTFLEDNWEPLFKPSWLCFRDMGNGKVMVISKSPRKTPVPGVEVRLYEGWVNGRKVYDPEGEYKPGMVIKVGD